MPDLPATLTTPDQEPVVVSDQPVQNQEVHEENRALAEAAAQEMLDGLHGQPPEPEAPARPRDENGRFLAAKQPEPTSPVPVVDPVWVEVAKDQGFTDTEIAGWKSDRDAETQISSRRYVNQMKAMQSLGLDPQALTEFQQWRQQQGKPAVTPQTPVPTATPDFALELDENELAPEVVKPIKAMVDQLNKVTALSASVNQENQQLRQKVADMEGYVRQSAEQAKAAQSEAQQAAAWDEVAAAVPGFSEYFGKISDLKRLVFANPDDPKAADGEVFFNRLTRSWNRYSKVIPDERKAAALAIKDAWNGLPFSRMPKNGRTNGNGALQPGSVIRSQPRRGAQVEPTDSSWEAERERQLAAAGAAYEQAGGVNPFASALG